jgi:hypothetical protein
MKLTEAKSTATAEYSAQQQLADQLIERVGGIVRSRKGGILEPLRLRYGESLAPQKVGLLRNTTLGNTYLAPVLTANQAILLTEEQMRLQLTLPSLR